MVLDYKIDCEVRLYLNKLFLSAPPELIELWQTLWEENDQ